VQIFLLFPSGEREIGLVLTADFDRMRIVLRGRSDTLEFQRVKRDWISEAGERVEIEAILAEPSSAAPPN
jgi:hypothetical protein